MPTETPSIPALNSNPTVDKENYVLELKTLDGNNKGFKFWTINFKSLEAARNHFTLNSTKQEKGEDVILALINSAMGFRLRSQATNKLLAPNEKGTGGMAVAEKLNRLNTGGDNVVIITEKDAESYVPGQRDVESVSGLLKAKTAIAKLIGAAKEAGDKPKLLELLGRYKEVDARIKLLQEAEEARLLEGIEDAVA